MKRCKMFLMMAGTAVLLFTGGLYSCNREREPEPVTEPEPEIEIEPVMTLHDKPLPVIKKVIEGRWQWNSSYGGGIGGVIHHDSAFVEFGDDRYVVEDKYGRRGTVGITWDEQDITDYNIIYSTHVMCYRYEYAEGGSVSRIGGWYFDLITNDTLYSGGYDSKAPPYYPGSDMTGVGHMFIRVKQQDEKTGLEPEIEPVMTLHDKPLPVIKKVIEGRWQWKESYVGGIVGVERHDSTFVEFGDDRYTVDDKYGRRDTAGITWEEHNITDYNFKYRTHIMWNGYSSPGEGGSVYSNRGWYFAEIKNDTLYSGVYNLNAPPYNPDLDTIGITNLFIRVKQALSQEDEKNRRDK
jgi:hypothetical protein